MRVGRSVEGSENRKTKNRWELSLWFSFCFNFEMSSLKVLQYQNGGGDWKDDKDDKRFVIISNLFLFGFSIFVSNCFALQLLLR